MMDWIFSLTLELWGHRGYRILLMVVAVEVVILMTLIAALMVQTRRRFTRDDTRERLVEELHQVLETHDKKSEPILIAQWVNKKSIPVSVALREALLELGLTEHHEAARDAWVQLGFADQAREHLEKGGLRKRLKSIRRIYVFADKSDQEPIMTALAEESDYRFRVTSAQVLARIGDGLGVLQALTGVTLPRRIMEQPFYSTFRALPSNQLSLILEQDLSVLGPRVSTILFEVAAERGIGSLLPIIEALANDKQLEQRLGSTKIATAMKNDTGREILRSLIHDEAWQVRAQALRGLGLTGNADDLSPLNKALEDGEFWVRANAEWALDSLRRKGHIATVETAAPASKTSVDPALEPV